MTYDELFNMLEWKKTATDNEQKHKNKSAGISCSVTVG